MAMLNPMLKNPGFMVIMAHWPQKEKFHACVCMCVFYVGHPTMSNDPLLRAASCAELFPAVTLIHTNKRIHTAGEISGCPSPLIPSTIHHHCICCSCSQSWKLISEVLACLCSLSLFRFCPLPSPPPLFLSNLYFLLISSHTKDGRLFLPFFPFFTLSWLGRDFKG